jgi:general stress protein YciG
LWILFQANVSKYGAKHFSVMGKKGGNTTKSRQDPGFYSRIGKMGGTARRQKKMAQEST